MKSFDAFGKPVQEFQVKTACGGYLSICSLASVAILFFSELHYFFQYETRDHMVIDQHQDQKQVSIAFNVSFPNAPCALLGVNLLDQKKANVMHVWTEIYKTRLSSSGRPVGSKVRDSLANVINHMQEVAESPGAGASVRTSHATTHLRCPSCFQAHEDEDDCCTTCEDIKAEFKKRGFQEQPRDYMFGQCSNEVYTRSPASQGEGCRLDVGLRVKKVPATLHIGVPRYFNTAHLPKTENPESLATSLDFSHDIASLSFGPDFPGLVHVLDSREKRSSFAPDSAHYQYNVHVIPTQFKEDGRAPIASHQYSVLEFEKGVGVRTSKGDAMAPGIWMEYDFTPFEVKVTKSRKSMWHFLTECCAILGGVFAFSGMLDNFVYQFNSRTAAKNFGVDIQMVGQ